MTEIAQITYLKDLRTSATHLKSLQTLITDAPIDNKGKGEAFSPTDLMSASLASCMLTITGIAAKAHGFSIDGATALVSKRMESGPRRVSEIGIELTFPPNGYSQKQKQLIEYAALNCPVAKSLHPELVQNVTFTYLKKRP